MSKPKNTIDFETAYRWMRCSGYNSNFKLCLAGSYAEIDVYGRAVRLPNSSRSAEQSQKKAAGNGPSASSSILTQIIDDRAADEDADRPTELYTPEKGRKKQAGRNSKKLRLLINQNFPPETSWLLTFTMSDRPELEEALKRFDKLHRKLRKNVPGIKWLAVPEIGEQGGYHLHMVIDRELPMTREKAKPFIETGVIKSCAGALRSMWRHGFVHAKQLNGGGNLGAHMSQYLTKNAKHSEMKNRHSFYRSDNLGQWIEMRGQDAIDYITECILEPGLRPIYSYQQEDVEYIEWIKHFEFRVDAVGESTDENIESPTAA